MSSAENAPKGILKSVDAKAASKKKVRFDDTARKPVQVLNFAKGFRELLLEYFEKEDIGNAVTLKAEVSDDMEPHKKFSHNTDVCIVFSSKNFPLSWVDTESYINLEKLRAKPNLKMILIEVEPKSNPSDYMKEIINAAKRVYTKKDEALAITLLKEECAHNVLVILDEFGTELNEPLKKAAFRGLIMLYVAINNSDPETILGYYEPYQKKLNELNEYFKSEKQKHFDASFKNEEQKHSDEREFENIIQFSAFVSWLEAMVNEEKKYIWGHFLANIEQLYLPQLTQQASGSVVEDSEMRDQIVERTAFITTLEEVSDEERGEPEEKPNRRGPTPFWSVQSGQITKNTAVEQLAELTI